MTRKQASPARAFYETAAKVLREQGRQTSQAEVARIVGTTRAQFARAVLTGALTAGTLARWLRAWRESGLPPIVVMIESDKVHAVVVAPAPTGTL